MTAAARIFCRPISGPTPPLMLLRSLVLAGLAALLALPVAAQEAERPPLTVAQIMQDPETWIGAWPSDVHWTDAGDYVYFEWNPQGQFPADSLYRVRPGDVEPEKVSPAERRALPPRFDGWHADRLTYDADFSQRVFARDGDLWLYELGARHAPAPHRDARARERAPASRPTGSASCSTRDDNIFALDLGDGARAPASPTFARATSRKTPSPARRTLSSNASRSTSSTCSARPRARTRSAKPPRSARRPRAISRRRFTSATRACSSSSSAPTSGSSPSSSPRTRRRRRRA